MNSAVIGNLKAILSLDTTNFDKGATNSEANAKKFADRLAKDLEPSQKRINALMRDFLGPREIGLANDMARAIQQIGGASRLTANDQARVNKSVTEALAHYRALGQEAPKHLQDLAAATAKVQTPTDKLTAGLSGLVGKASSIAGLFGVTLGAGALASFATGAINAADEAVDLARKMDVSVEAAQRFGYAARQSGSDIGAVTQSIVKMNNNLAEGDKSTVAALKSVGLSFDAVRAMKPEDAFRAIADAIGKIQDPMLQTQVAMELFGKAGADLLPMIRDNSLAVADGIRVMSEDTAKRLEAAKQSWQNFWDGVTTLTGEALGGLSRMMTSTVDDMRAILDGAGRRPLKPRTDAKTAKVTDIAQLQAMTAGMEPVEVGSLDLGLSADEKAKRKKELEDEEKRLRALTSAAKQAEDAYRSFERQRISGFSDAERQRQAFEARFLKERGLTGAAAWAQSIVRPMNLSTLLGGSALSIPTAPPPVNPFKISPINLKSLTKDALDIETLLKGVKVPAERFAVSMQGMFAMLPQTLLAAFTGGGNAFNSVAGMFGSGILGAPSISGKLTDKLSGSFLGKTLGGAIGGVIPGIGALLGPALGKLFGAIVNIGSNSTKKSREEFAKQAGFENLDNLYAKLKSLGAEGEKLANIGLNVIGKKDKAANEKWMKDVTAFFDRLEKVPGKVAELSSALGKFGGAIPKQLEPLLDSILGSSNLSADLRKQLEGMRKPSWQAAQELAASFGVDPGALGAGFNQSRIADSAFSIKRAADLFGSFAGSDSDAIIRGLADELSQVAEEAKKNNVALPKEVQNLVRRADELNLLIDSNGERIDSALLTFADIEDEYQKQVVGLLQDIKALLGGKAAGGSAAVGDSGGVSVGGTPRLWNNYDVGAEVAMPGFAGGTHGAFMDFGVGTPVMLHGKERVMTAGEGSGGVNLTINAIDAKSFEGFLRRGGADVIARTLPNASSRYTGTRF